MVLHSAWQDRFLGYYTGPSTNYFPFPAPLPTTSSIVPIGIPQRSALPSSYSACTLSCVWLIATPWTIAHQAPLPMGFPRQEYWSGLPFPPPGDLPTPGIKPECFVFPALAGGFFTTVPPWKPSCLCLWLILSSTWDSLHFFLSERGKQRQRDVYYLNKSFITVQYKKMRTPWKTEIFSLTEKPNITFYYVCHGLDLTETEDIKKRW